MYTVVLQEGSGVPNIQLKSTALEMTDSIAWNHAIRCEGNNAERMWIFLSTLG